MPAPSSSDTKYLEVHGSKWRVVVNVPRQLKGKLGTKLKRALGTDSLSEANRIKWDIIAELKAVIEQAQNPAMTKDAALSLARVKAMEEARRLSRQRLLALTTDELQRIDDRIEDRAEEFAGAPIGVGDMGMPEYEPERDALAMQFIAIAKNAETPVDFHHDKYMSMSNVKSRTAADDKGPLSTSSRGARAKAYPLLSNRSQSVRPFVSVTTCTNWWAKMILPPSTNTSVGFRSSGRGSKGGTRSSSTCGEAVGSRSRCRPRTRRRGRSKTGK